MALNIAWGPMAHHSFTLSEYHPFTLSLYRPFVLSLSKGSR